MKALAEAWRGLSEDEKKVHNAKTEAQKAQYETAMVAYKATQVQQPASKPAKAAAEPKVKGKKPKAEKDPNAPKRALSPFFLFIQERRPVLSAEFSNLSNTELVKAISEEWRNLNED